MERQLKERLIGAAVLVAAAVIMVPEMFSGPHLHPEPTVDSSSASSGQVKTYHIELQSAQSAAPAPVTAVVAPVAQPRDEVPLPAADANAADLSSSVSSSSVSALQRLASEPAAAVAKVASQTTSVPLETPAKGASNTKTAGGEWTVQVGSFATQDKAHQIVGKLKGQGYPAYVGTVAVAGKTLYRVRVGAMPERSVAESTLQKLKSSYPGASVMPANR